MSKRTAGPWGIWTESDGRGSSILVGIHGVRPIARILKSFGGAHAEADAKLIAAAPDLLDAAKAVLAGLHARIDRAHPSAVPVFEGIVELHAAIAKAEGR